MAEIDRNKLIKAIHLYVGFIAGWDHIDVGVRLHRIKRIHGKDVLLGMEKFMLFAEDNQWEHEETAKILIYDLSNYDNSSAPAVLAYKNYERKQVEEKLFALYLFNDGVYNVVIGTDVYELSVYKVSETEERCDLTKYGETSFINEEDLGEKVEWAYLPLDKRHIIICEIVRRIRYMKMKALNRSLKLQLAMDKVGQETCIELSKGFLLLEHFLEKCSAGGPM